MRVAVIQNVTLNDHRSVHSHNVACELQKREVTVDLILQKTDEDLQFVNRPYNLIQFPGETYSVTGQLQFMRHLLTHIKKESYDIIHAKNPFSSVLIPVLLRKSALIKSRVIYDMRGLWVDFGVHAGQFSPAAGKALNRVDTVVMHFCDHIIAISSELKWTLMMRGIPEEKITVITGSGVNIPEITGAPAENVKTLLGITGIIIGYVGTVSVSRQSDVLIKAFQHVQKHCKDCYLVLLGPEDGSVSNLVSQTKNVIHLETVPHEKAVSLMKSFDVAVAYHDRDVPIFNVAVPIKVLEYMAAGVPIVTTNHTMYKNVLVHRKTGYLTESDPEQFAQGIVTVLEDSYLQKYMVEQARKEVENYSIKALVDQLESLYERVY